MFRIDIRQSAGAFTLAALAGAAPAQSTDPLTPTLPTVEVSDATQTPGLLPLDTPVETGSRLGLTPRETPASVTVVDRSTIEARGAQDTQEILRAIPGVSAHNAPGSMSASYRGFTGNSVTQLYNGITVHYGSATRAVDSWISAARRAPWTAGFTTAWRPWAVHRAFCMVQAPWVAPSTTSPRRPNATISAKASCGWARTTSRKSRWA